MAADSAAHGIRELDATGAIGLLSAESDPPYDRPPLSKGVWKDKPLDSVWRDTASQKADLHLGCRIEALDLSARKVTDQNGKSYTFDKLLLGTGARPRHLAISCDEVIYYRTVADYRRLHELSQKKERFAVIGGGFIGSEIAAALAMHHRKVFLVFPGDGICARIFPRELSQFLNGYYRERGVEVLPGQSVAALERQRERFVLKTTGGQQIEVDAVVAGIGVEPNVDLAQNAGLRVEDGIVVDEFLQTSHPDVYAAGDVAAFYNRALGKRLRVEHEDNANTMGKLAGRNMAGIPQAYDYLPFFYSDLFDLGYEAVGELNAKMETTVDWKEPFKQGVICYQRDGRVTGVLLWNVWGQVDAARELIAERRSFRPEEIKERLLKAG